jgi:hypothetical protein
VKQYLKPRAYKQSKGVAWGLRAPGSLMACLLKNEPASYPVCGKVKSVKDEAVAKASLNRASQSQRVDPKPSELPMGRLKRE